MAPLATPVPKFCAVKVIWKFRPNRVGLGTAKLAAKSASPASTLVATLTWLLPG
jgi:hypothetical protein